MYLHVTTKIKGHPNDDMLKRHGYRGFPSFGFLDAKGTLIAKHTGGRTIAGFDTTAKKAHSYVALRDQAAQGDKAAQQHLFVQNLGLGQFNYSRGALALAANRSDMSKSLIKKAEQALTDIQYAELTAALRGKLATIERAEYTLRYNALNVEFFKAGKVPSGYSATSVYMTVMRHAQSTRDANLFEQALNGYKKMYAGQARYERMIERYEGQLEDLRK